jgi:hypothetical protein
MFTGYLVPNTLNRLYNATYRMPLSPVLTVLHKIQGLQHSVPKIDVRRNTNEEMFTCLLSEGLTWASGLSGAPGCYTVYHYI